MRLHPSSCIIASEQIQLDMHHVLTVSKLSVNSIFCLNWYMQVLDKAAAAQPPSGQTPPDPSLAGKVGTLKLLSSKATWAIIIVNFVNHWGYFIYLNWMPSYFVKVLGVDLRASSFLSFLPWTVMALGSTSAGQLQCSQACSRCPRVAAAPAKTLQTQPAWPKLFDLSATERHS